MRVATVTISLDDGSGCYVVAVPVESFHYYAVAEAAGSAGAQLAAAFARDRADGSEWDPVAWRARQNSIMRSRNNATDPT